jgi:hypothetical protein
VQNLSMLDTELTGVMQRKAGEKCSVKLSARTVLDEWTSNICTRGEDRRF